MFDTYPQATKNFYSRIVSAMLLNAVAYQRGMFDVLLSDIGDEDRDVITWIRFVEAIPELRYQLGMLEI